MRPESLGGDSGRFYEPPEAHADISNYRFSVDAPLAAVASLEGLLFQSALCSTEAVCRAFFANDRVNLVIGLPILLGSLWLTR